MYELPTLPGGRRMQNLVLSYSNSDHPTPKSLYVEASMNNELAIAVLVARIWWAEQYVRSHPSGANTINGTKVDEYDRVLLSRFVGPEQAVYTEISGKKEGHDPIGAINAMKKYWGPANDMMCGKNGAMCGYG